MARDRLEALARIARQLQADELAREAESVMARTTGNRFFVACVGQFKRGKSTLINALLDDDLLPTAVVPVTSVITIVRAGRELHPVVHFLDGSERAIDRGARDTLARGRERAAAEIARLDQLSRESSSLPESDSPPT